MSELHQNEDLELLQSNCEIWEILYFFMTPSLSDLWNCGEWTLFDGSTSIILGLFTLFSPSYRDVVEDSIRIEIPIIFWLECISESISLYMYIDNINFVLTK